jgi:hypothetical protein
VAGAKNFEPTLFDELELQVDKDIVRSFPAFSLTQIYKCYLRNEELLESLAAFYGCENKSRGSRRMTMGSGATANGLDVAVREIYQTDKRVVLKRFFDLSSFTYELREKNQDGKRLGYGIDRKGIFYFFDLDEVLLMKVHSAVLLGNISKAQDAIIRVELEAVGDEVGSGCWGERGKRKKQVGQEVQETDQDPPEWYVKGGDGKIFGPVRGPCIGV